MVVVQAMVWWWMEEETSPTAEVGVGGVGKEPNSLGPWCRAAAMSFV
jgi:hypothetical protein